MKDEKLTENAFRRSIATAVLGIVLCVAALCSTTWAWFTANRQSSVTTLRSAVFSPSVSVDGVPLDGNCFTAALTPDDRHTVILQNSGTAEKIYYTLTADGSTYTTVQILNGETITLYLRVAQGTSVAICANWGAPQGALYGLDACIEISETPHQSYTVAEGATIEMLAGYYGVSASDILRYNGIDALVEGAEIKIPNTARTIPFEMPAPAEESETPPPETAAAEGGATEPAAPTTEPTPENEESDQP